MPPRATDEQLDDDLRRTQSSAASGRGAPGKSTRSSKLPSRSGEPKAAPVAPASAPDSAVEAVEDPFWFAGGEHEGDADEAEVVGPLAAFAPAFGDAVRGVTLHLGSPRARSTGVEALAEGEAIHVADGGLDLESPEGLALVGHELAHVMQQRDGRVDADRTRDGGPVARDPGLEDEADAVGARVARGEAAGIATPEGSVAVPIAQYRVGAGLKAGDPVTVLADEARDRVEVRGTVLSAERNWGYRVQYLNADGEEEGAVFALDKLDLIDGHDYGGRGAGQVADRVVPGTKDNLKDARKRRRTPASSAKKPAAAPKRNIGSDARDALRSMKATDFDALFDDVAPADAYALVAADSQGSELDDDGDGDARPNNMKRLRRHAERYIETDIKGAAHVVAGTATFRPRHAKQVLPHHRRCGWPSGADDPSLELEIYAYGARTYAATSGQAKGRLTMADGGSRATFTPASGEPIIGTVSGFSADVPGVIQLLPIAAAAASDASSGSDEDAPAPAPVPITLTAVVNDTLHARDEDGYFYTLLREGSGTTLSLGSEQARASGKAGGGFATTRTDLAPLESYVWYGPETKDGVGEFGGRLHPDRRLGTLADAGDRTVVFYPESSAEDLMDGDDDAEVFQRTNTPHGSRVAYFKAAGRMPLRWFGHPRDGERIGLRKPDYGGAFTDALTQADVDAQLAEYGEQQHRFGSFAVPDTVSLWQLHSAVGAPRLLRDPQDPFEKPGVADRKKNKDRTSHWRDGKWSKPAPQGWESRAPASKARGTMMDGASASDEARNSVDDHGLGKDLTHPRQEWCHLIGHGDGGSEDQSNLAAGSHYANTEQLALEEGARALRAVGKAHGVVVLLKVTTYLTPGTKCADAIRYKVALWRKPKPAAKGKPAAAAAVAAASTDVSASKDGAAAAVSAASVEAEAVEIFDHLFDGQSESFDRNEFAIAKQTLIEAGARQFAEWKLDVDLEAAPEVESEVDDEDAGSSPVLERNRVGRFTAEHRQLISWDTQTDGNCAFNGFAQALVRLVREQRLTAPQVAAPLAAVDAGITADRIDALVPALDDDTAAIENALKGPLRALAIARLAASPARALQVGEIYAQELNRRVRAALLPAEAGDDAAELFRQGSPLGRRLDDQAQVAAALVASTLPVVAGPLVVRAAVDQWVNNNTAANAAAFVNDGMPAYLENMAHNGEHAGGPELNELAAVYQLHVSTLRGVGGGGVVRLGSDSNCGFAVLTAYWGVPQIEAARTIELFEGDVVAAHGQRRIAFGRKTPAQVAVLAAGAPPRALLDAHPGNAAAAAVAYAALIAQYNVLRAASYQHSVEIGMYRHNAFNHWSGVTNAHGNANLDDVQDRLPADAADTPAMIDEVGQRGGSGDLDDATLAALRAVPDDAFELEVSGRSKPAAKASDKASSSDASVGKRGAARFVQRPAKIGGTELSFARHMFERSSASASSRGKFAMNSVDPSFASGQRAAVVNAANPSLHGGAGIALALQDAAGAKATAAWAAQGKKQLLGTGDAVVGDSGDLSAQGVGSVIHAVAPMGNNPRWRELLRHVCQRVLAVAAADNIEVLVMCSLGTGIYGLPPDEAAQLIVDTFTEGLAKAPPSGQRWPTRVVFNNFPGAPPALVSAAPPAVRGGMDVRGMGKPPAAAAAKDAAPKASASMSDTH